jgi:hypothetical protein
VAPALAILSFNLFAGFGWPLVFAVGRGSSFSLLRTFPAYWFTIFAAGAFCSFAVLALQGLAAHLLPRQLFLRFSDALQAAALCLLLSSYWLGPSFNSPAALSAAQNQSLLQWLPAYWFLGLFNQLNGSIHPELISLAHRAWIALALSAVCALCALLLSYFRRLPTIVEQPDLLPAMRFRVLGFGNSLAGAITLFSLRTLLRSRRHRMILSIYVGLGIALVLGFTHIRSNGRASSVTGISTSFLLATILTMTLSVLALRVVVAIPIALPANWIFRTTQSCHRMHYQRAVRLSWLVLVVAPVLLVSCISLSADCWPQILGHLLLLLLLGILLVELCLLSFHKISFTCSYLAGKANLHFLFWVCLLVLSLWFRDIVEFESRILHQPRAYALLLLVSLNATLATCWLNRIRAHSESQLIFDQEAEPELVTLKFN